MKEDDRLKCLLEETKMVQRIISRMSNNSFLIKGWSLTLVVASLLVIGGFYNNDYYLVALIPLIVFWILDAYFVRLERLYGALYDWLIENRPICDDCLLEMNRVRLEKRFGKNIPSLVETMFSRALLGFYVFLLVVIVIFILRFILSSVRVVI